MSIWTEFGLARVAEISRQVPLRRELEAPWREIMAETNRNLAISARIDSFLREHKMLVRITYAGGMCPPWANRHPFRKCSTVHGDQFRVVIQRGGKLVKFNYWNSREDMLDDRRPEKEDVMTSIATYELPSTPKGICRVYGWFTEGEMEEMMAWKAR